MYDDAASQQENLEVDYQTALDAIEQVVKTASRQGMVVEASFLPLYKDGVIVARQISGLRLVTVPGIAP